MFTIEKRKFKVIFRLRAMPTSHVCSHGQIELTSERWSRPVGSFFQNRTLSTVGAYVNPGAKQNIASVQREPRRTCGEKYPAMGDKFSATGCVKK